jgi:hypothetical protein
MGKMIDEFNSYRTRMNERIMDTADTNIKRFIALDTTTYADGTLNVKTKEYHLGKCHDEGVSNTEMNEIFMIANLVGGSIVIPHYRRALEYWEELNSNLS